jgi:hypothetical protein
MLTRYGQVVGDVNAREVEDMSRKTEQFRRIPSYTRFRV